MGGFYMVEDWQHFLLPYQQAVNELKVKLRGIRKQYQDETQHSPIEFVTGRVKPVDSIKEKMIRRHVQEDRLEQDGHIAPLTKQINYLINIFNELAHNS